MSDKAPFASAVFRVAAKTQRANQDGSVETEVTLVPAAGPGSAALFGKKAPVGEFTMTVTTEAASRFCAGARLLVSVAEEK